MIFEQLEYTEIIELYTLNGMNFMECELYLSKTSFLLKKQKKKKKGLSEKVGLSWEKQEGVILQSLGEKHSRQNELQVQRPWGTLGRLGRVLSRIMMGCAFCFKTIIQVAVTKWGCGEGGAGTGRMKRLVKRQWHFQRDYDVYPRRQTGRLAVLIRREEEVSWRRG